MIECPVCHAAHVPNTLFCSECGTYLLDEERQGTDTLEVEQTEAPSPIKRDSAAGAQPQRTVYIRLRIGESGRMVELPLERPLQLGRLDPSQDVFPEVDLTQDGGAARGVSRRHARIWRRAEAVVVEDLDSVNGTFINGKQLVPYLPEALHNGDQLQLGNLLMAVELFSVNQMSADEVM